MKNLFTTAFFVALLAISAVAQTQTASVKLGFINTDAFYDEKAGITKLVNANKQLNTEFGTKFKELEDGGLKLQGIAKEMETMQKLPAAQFNRTAYSAKQEEGERLQRELNFKKTELETAVNKRRSAVIGPITQDVVNAIGEFAKKNGYSGIFDTAKLDGAGALLFLADAADVTKEFVTFYNARPAGAASTPTTRPNQ